MERLEPRVRRIAHEIVRSLPRVRAVDAVTEIGYPFAVRAQADWLGWQGVERELLAWMAENHAATRAKDRSRTAAVAAAFDEIVLAQVRRRRRLGGAAPDDPTSELLAVTAGGESLPDADIVSILRNWVVAVEALLATTVGLELADDEEAVRETYPLGGWRRVPVRLR